MQRSDGIVFTPDPVERHHPLNAGLVAWWLGLPEVSGGRQLFDLMGLNHGTLTNGPTWAADPGGFGAVNLDGSDDYVTCGSPAALNVQGPLTLSCWAYLPAVPSSGEPGIVTNGAYKFGLTYYINGQVYFYLGSGGSNVAAAVAAGGWRHLVGTWDGTTAAGGLKLYLAGQQIASAFSSNSTTGASGPFQVGNVSGNSGQYLNGRIGDVRLSNRCLSASEVAALYDQTVRGHPDTLRRVPGRVWGFLGAAVATSPQGPLSPSAAATSGSGRVWVNPGNVLAADGASATVLLPALSTSSRYLTATAFPFAVPSDATVNGFRWEVLRSSSAGLVADLAVRLVRAGVVQATDRASAAAWGTVAAYQAYGSSTDLVGGTWTPADVNGSGFGVALSAKNTSDTTDDTAAVDYVRMTVYFTPAGGGGTPTTAFAFLPFGGGNQPFPKCFVPPGSR